MWSVYFTLVLSSVILVSDIAESAFSRQCEHAGQCIFEPKGSNDRAYLDCVDMRCVCSRFLYIADVPSWDLQGNSTCLIAEGGPCGSDRGLDIGCQANAECVQGRCRKGEKVGTRKEGEICNEDVDCLKELKCSITSFYFQPTRRCTNKTFVSPFPKSDDHHPSGESEEMSSEKSETTPLYNNHGNRGASGQESREAPNNSGVSGTSSRNTKSGETQVRSVESRNENQGAAPAPSAVSPPQSAASGVGHSSHADMQTKSAGAGHNGEAQPQQNAGHKIFQISSLLPFILVSTVVAAAGGVGNGLLRELNC